MKEAAKRIKTGGCYWNSGMFIFRISILEEALRQFEPEIFRRYEKIEGLIQSQKKVDLEKAREEFLAIPKKIKHPLEPSREVDHSIDFALMVPLTSQKNSGISAFAVPAGFEWHDIGSWDALRKIHKTDARRNIVLGKVEKRNCSDSIFVAGKGMKIKAAGIDKLVVILTDKNTLIIPESRAQEVKRLYEAFHLTQKTVSKIFGDNLEPLHSNRADFP